MKKTPPPRPVATRQEPLQPQPAEQEWQQHEHVSEQVQADADRLLDSAGAPEVAKHAVDVACARHEQTEESRNAFAKSLGFQTYQAACEASRALGEMNGAVWHLTHRPAASGGVVVWNERDLRTVFTAASEAEAVRRFEEHKAEAAASGRSSAPADG